jgi:prepilin-type N-terminal cleavage/methylation domain-containing protein
MEVRREAMEWGSNGVVLQLKIGRWTLEVERCTFARMRVFSRSTAPAFTLIELLVVITIIVVLMGLLFPAFRGVQDQAKRTQAKNDLTQIVTAVNAFYTEYGKYPTVATTDAGATFGPRGAANNTLFIELRGITTTTLNPRQIAFINPPDAKDQNNPRSGIKVSTGEYFDPWGTAYAIALDADYDNTIPPSIPNYPDLTNPIRSGVISWTHGKDGVQGTRSPASSNFKDSDDVISWQ